MNVLRELECFYRSFAGEKGDIGLSGQGAPLYYFAVKKTLSPVIIAQYAIHAREYITTYLALMQIEDFMKRGKRGAVYFVPAVNPDGIEIALGGNPLYKANAFGVDLNVNFDARWGGGEKNSLFAGSENYIGKHPFSERETRALRDFTLSVKPYCTLSYHSKGEEIYWEFFQRGVNRARDYSLARAVSEITGYKIGDAGVSAGGYKDWCVEKLQIPALTIEVGEDSLTHPIGKEHAARIFAKNKDVIGCVTEFLAEEKWK